MCWGVYSSRVLLENLVQLAHLEYEERGVQMVIQDHWELMETPAHQEEMELQAYLAYLYVYYTLVMQCVTRVK